MELGGGILGLIALITWVITAIGGFVMLGIWVRRGGMRGGASRIAPGLIFGHFLLAVVGLIVWIIYVVADVEVLTWVSFVILLVVAALGFTMFGRWLRQPRAGGTSGTGGDSATEATAERHFPVAVVSAHGLFAVATLVLVFLVAIGVGGS